MLWLRERVFLIGTLEHTPSIDWLLERARAAVIRYGVTNIVLDPYNEIEASRPSLLPMTPTRSSRAIANTAFTTRLRARTARSAFIVLSRRPN